MLTYICYIDRRNNIMDIEDLVKNIDDNHPLKQAYLCRHRYYTDFLNTMGVFRKNLTKKEYVNILKKFQFNKAFDEQKYLQVVSEINVLYYILRFYNNHFKYEPKYNNGYNPECSFSFQSKTINLEVKCPNMQNRLEAEQRDMVKIFLPERIPNHESIVNGVKSVIEPNLKNLEITGSEELNRMDNKLKDFLISAQAKFPVSDDSNFNVLAISLDIISDLDEWYTYIWGQTGAFTDHSFIEENYENVDAILLTTPMCSHIRWRCYAEKDMWKLEESTNLLFLNSDREYSETGKFYFSEGMKIFGGLTYDFLCFQAELDKQEIKKNKTEIYNPQDYPERYFRFKEIDLHIITNFFNYLNEKSKMK